MDIVETDRGFAKAKFKDRNGEVCSIQESSSAMEASIWLGVDEPYVKVMTKRDGWQDVPLPEDVSINSRMHLNQEQAAALLPLLERFVQTGQLHK